MNSLLPPPTSPPHRMDQLLQIKTNIIKSYFSNKRVILGPYKTRLLYRRGLKTDYWPAGRLQDTPRHPALLPTDQLCVDAMRGFLPAHLAGGCLHLRVGTRQMAVRAWMGHASGPHSHLHIPAGF